MAKSETQLAELGEFLKQSVELGYGGESSQPRREKDGSTTIEFSEGLWRVRDNYFTSKDARVFAGQEMAFYRGGPFWYMNYHGHAEEDCDTDAAYEILKAALKHPDPDLPVRGPFERFEVDNGNYEMGDGEQELILPNDLSRFAVVEYVSVYKSDLEDDISSYRGHFLGGVLEG